MEIQGQKEFDEMQCCFKSLQDTGRVIEQGSVSWVDFKRHESAQNTYNESLRRYLAAA